MKTNYAIHNYLGNNNNNSKLNLRKHIIIKILKYNIVLLKIEIK